MHDEIMKETNFSSVQNNGEYMAEKEEEKLQINPPGRGKTNVFFCDQRLPKCCFSYCYLLI